MFLSVFAFGGSRRADVGDRSPWGDFWFTPVGLKSSTGLRVTQASAMRLASVYACTKVISETFAAMPFRMYRRRADGGRDPETKHWLVRLMRQPNAWQTAFEWREMLQAHLCLRGNAFNEIFDDGRGAVTDLIPIHPDRIKAVASTTGYFYRITNPDGTTRDVPRGRIWHVRALTNDGVVGLNPIEVAAEVMGMALAGQSYAARFFANDARPAGWIEYDGKFADPNVKQTFRDGWQRMQGGSNRGKTAILEKGFKYHETAVNNADAQFLELMKQSRSEIAGIYRVPPHKIGDLERSTFSNIEQQSLDFIQDCMLPWAERWESSVETAFLTDTDLDTFEIEYDFSNLLRGDMAARTAYYSGNIMNGSLTRNEARIAEGRNPLPGLSEPLQPVNMQAPGSPPPEPGAAPRTPPQPAPAPSPKPRKKAEAEGRTEALAHAAAERVARREAKELAAVLSKTPVLADELVAFEAKHAAFVAQALGVSDDAAEQYIQARRDDPIRPTHAEEDVFATALPRLETLALKGTL